jgi:hypothetical protein
LAAGSFGKSVQLIEDDNGNPELKGTDGRETAEFGQVVDEAIGVWN